ncbi:uncharacterized protein RCC_07635 [Ramularia collo-cygni]|uniref:Uncharacterized protein n=1 Tax=Ramularia collo-cygni TaxID=112498 RepID=A0A2D3V8L0_9PEZI|nr:uncharacterized protein RCC_07635 [Ramularia collo-cygni]CZT21770.1 uncharacterized protein RCC_07635 [Ramularia collo-cygni]
MTDHSEKSQEAIQEAEKPSIPPPAYQETATTYIEEDNFHAVDAPDAMSQDTMAPPAGPSKAVHEEAQDTDRPNMPDRTSSILKGKGRAYSPSPVVDTPDQIVSHDEKVEEGSIIPQTSPSAEEEKRALQVHFAEPQEEEAAPVLPARPSDIRVSESFSHEIIHSDPVLSNFPLEAAGALPLRYVFAWSRPLLESPTLEIRPADNATIPSSSPAVPPTRLWRLNYDKKYHARLHRYTSTPQDYNSKAQLGDFPYRQIAEIKFPEFIIPGIGCGAMVKFDMHEEELARLGSYATARGKKPMPRVQKFMQCEGWLTTSYTMEVPVLDHLQASWRTVPRPKGTNPGSGLENAKETAIVERKTTDMEKEAKKQNIALVTISDMVAMAKRTLHDETWTPYAPQQLVVESDGRVIATYQRASPFAKHAGVLTIHNQELSHVSCVPEFIEGIVIATTTMVGMQDRIGLASSLMEAASTSGKWSQGQWMRVQREWKDRKARRQSVGTHPYGNTAARQQPSRDSEEVGSEAFDDGLEGAIGVEEREAARREQLAWDENLKARSADDDGLGDVLSAEEREAARREHLAWEEWSRTNALSDLPGTEPRDQAAGWQEKNQDHLRLRTIYA